MQGWEYRVVDIDVGTWVDRPDAQETDFNVDFGSRGFELVCVMRYSEQRARAFFKRPLRPAPRITAMGKRDAATGAAFTIDE